MQAEEISVEEDGDKHRNFSTSRANANGLTDGVTLAYHRICIIHGLASLFIQDIILSDNCGHSLTVGSINLILRAINNVVVTCDVCLAAEGKHFL
jgi:hypothetical protein